MGSWTEKVNLFVVPVEDTQSSIRIRKIIDDSENEDFTFKRDPYFVPDFVFQGTGKSRRGKTTSLRLLCVCLHPVQSLTSHETSLLVPVRFPSFVAHLPLLLVGVESV